MGVGIGLWLLDLGYEGEGGCMASWRKGGEGAVAQKRGVRGSKKGVYRQSELLPAVVTSS